MNLSDLGWGPQWAENFEPFAARGLLPARVGREQRGGYLLLAEAGELLGEVTGRLMHRAASRSDYPAVGDWVAIQPRPGEPRAAIHAILPRKSRFARKVAGGRTEPQVLAANIDTALLVSGLDGDFNVRRIERYLALAYESGAAPVVVLNKADLCEDVPGRVLDVENVAPAVPVMAISAADRVGLEALADYLRPGTTVALLGSSGVGKSTLINALLGSKRQAVAEVRAGDSRGRHTTTARELIALAGGALLIDTPGLRELQLWSDEPSPAAGFEDIDRLESGCRFRDCTHTSEPGCAVRAALADGTLESARWENYLQMQRELAYLARRQDDSLRRLEQAKWRKIAQWYRKHVKGRDGP